MVAAAAAAAVAVLRGRPSHARRTPLRPSPSIDLFLSSVVSSAFTYFLWPSRAQDCFRVFDASVDVLLGADFASGTDAAALDAANAASSNAEYTTVSGGV